jgi:putative transposase
LTRGYDFPEVYDLLEEEYVWLYNSHPIKRRRSNIKREKLPEHRARQWIVERTHSWMKRFRWLLIRCEKNVENDIVMLHFACAWIIHKTPGIFG